MLKETFINLVEKYSNDTHLTKALWNEIEQYYSNKKRHYHTLLHLESVLIQLQKVKDKIECWDTLLFSLYYHDVIYNTLKSDNEEQSAKFAERVMIKINVPAKIITNCKTQILATKLHLENPSTDINYFNDADLSILGQSWNIYSTYYKNVRKEYFVYPKFLYNSGRKKVLKQFLEMKRIFKTQYFFDKFELIAKENLLKEFHIL